MRWNMVEVDDSNLTEGDCDEANAQCGGASKLVAIVSKHLRYVCHVIYLGKNYGL